MAASWAAIQPSPAVVELLVLELPESDPDPPESVPDWVDLASVDELDFASWSVAAFALGAGLLDRSFLAQPEPLNTIAGVDNSLRTSAPQRSHLAGPGSLTPCITSMMCPFVQM